MSRSNSNIDHYSVWNYDSDLKLDSSEKIFKFVLEKSKLAPSAHNSQPWKVKLNGEKIEIFADASKHLKISDPLKRQLYLSLGCLAATVVSVCDAIGIAYDLNWSYDKSNSLACSIGLTTSSGVTLDKNLLNALHSRVTNRLSYKNTAIDPTIINDMKALLSEDGVVLKVITNSKNLDHVKKSLLQAMELAFSNKGFRQELAAWIRPSSKKYGDGMPGFTLNIPKPVSFLIPSLLKKINLTKVMMIENNKIVNETPSFAIISVKNDEPLDWLKAGFEAQRLFLFLTSKEIAFHVLNAAVENNEVKDGLRKRLSLSDHPVMIWRMGHPIRSVEHSPRR